MKIGIMYGQTGQTLLVPHKSFSCGTRPCHCCSPPFIWKGAFWALVLYRLLEHTKTKTPFRLLKPEHFLAYSSAAFVSAELRFNPTYLTYNISRL